VRNAVGWSYIRVGFWIAVAAGCVAIGTVEWMYFCGAGAIAMAGVQTWREVRRRAQANKVAILKLEPGKVPDALPAPEPERPTRKTKPNLPEIPAARVVGDAPPLRRTEPDPTAGPQFLKPED